MKLRQLGKLNAVPNIYPELTQAHADNVASNARLIDVGGCGPTATAVSAARQKLVANRVGDHSVMRARAARPIAA